MARRWMLVGVVGAVLAAPAGAAPYWVAWEGDDFPENEGWERVSGPQGAQANRTLANGVLTYDSLFDIDVFDFSRMTMPGKFTVEPGETFVVQWRLRVNEAYGVLPYDPGFALSSDDDWSLGMTFGLSELKFAFVGGLVSYTPNAFHEYEVRTDDFRAYRLYIDGDLVNEGSFFEPSPVRSQIAWGDAVQGARSLANWDYFRFGVVPEPTSVLLTGVGLLITSLRSRRG